MIDAIFYFIVAIACLLATYLPQGKGFGAELAGPFCYVVSLIALIAAVQSFADAKMKARKTVTTQKHR